MASFITLTLNDLRPLLAPFAVGELLSIQPIPQGTTNSIFCLSTSQGRFALICHEARVQPDSIPFFLGLMRHLAAAGIPCPMPLTCSDGTLTFAVAGRPSVLLPWLGGHSPAAATPSLLHQLGQLLARMHLAGQDYLPRLASPYHRDLIAPLWAISAPQADKLLPGSHAVLQGLLDRGADQPADDGLPHGAIHGDLFLDNLLVDDRGQIAAVLDFNYACTDSWLYDLAMTINGTCWDAVAAGFSPPLTQVLLAGYDSIRPLTSGQSGGERAALPAMLIAALQPYLHIRLYDWITQPDNPNASPKTLQAFWQRLHWALALDKGGWQRLLGF
ncbi:MAG: homoserine kinase [Alphaproteobacteria bacterium]|nr:homoserine kinase [Alphaproteobacteria bacterium]